MLNISFGKRIQEEKDVHKTGGRSRDQSGPSYLSSSVSASNSGWPQRGEPYNYYRSDDYQRRHLQYSHVTGGYDHMSRGYDAVDGRIGKGRDSNSGYHRVGSNVSTGDRLGRRDGWHDGWRGGWRDGWRDSTSRDRRVEPSVSTGDRLGRRDGWRDSTSRDRRVEPSVSTGNRLGSGRNLTRDPRVGSDDGPGRNNYYLQQKSDRNSPSRGRKKRLMSNCKKEGCVHYSCRVYVLI